MKHRHTHTDTHTNTHQPTQKTTTKHTKQQQMMLASSLLAAAALCTLSVSAGKIPNHGRKQFPPETSQIGLCAQFFPPAKSNQLAKDAQQIPVCPYGIPGSDLHYVCGDYSSTDAAQVCASFGWRLASITELGNALVAASLLVECGGSNGDVEAWVGTYNGLAADPCMYMLGAGDTYWGVYANLGIQYCQTQRHNIICQDIPVFTETSTVATLTETIASGTTTETETETTTKTVCPTPTCCYSSSDSSSDCGCWSNQNCCWDKQANKQASNNQLKSKGHPECPNCPPQAPNCNSECFRCNQGSCTKVCPVTRNGIRVLQKDILPGDAAAECERHGWTLLDMVSTQESEVLALLRECGYGPDYVAGWIRSFNGVNANCTFVESNIDDNVDKAVISYPVFNFCDGAYPVLCQDRCKQPAGPGGDEGLISLVFETVTDVISTTTPAETDTVTVTTTVFEVLQKKQQS